MVVLKKVVFLQYTAAISASVTSLGLASAVAWSSPALPHFISRSENQFSKLEIYWIVPLLTIGCALGFLINPFINERLGNKKTLLLYSIPQLISWAILLFAENYIVVIYMSRLLSGIGYGAGACAQTVYLSEIGNRENRGIFMVIAKLTMSIGFFLTVLIGAYCSYYTLNLFLLMLPVFFLLTFPFMPDSSYFLKKNQESEQELKYPRDTILGIIYEEEEDFLTKEEANLMKIKEIEKNLGVEKFMKTEDATQIGRIIEMDKNNITENTTQIVKLIKEGTKIKEFLEEEDTREDNCTQKLGDAEKEIKEEESKKDDNKLKRLFTIRSNRRAFIIITLFGAQNVFSGFTTTRYFTQRLLTFEGSPISAKKSVLLLAAVSILNSLISTFIIEKYKRRNIFLSMCSLATLSLGTVGLFFCLKNYNYHVDNFNWLPLFGLMVYDFSITSGNYNMSMIYQGELLSNDVKSIGITLTRVTLMIFSFSAAFVFQILFDVFPIYVLFWIFAVSCFFLTLIIFRLTPETKGKSLEEIQKLLKLKN